MGKEQVKELNSATCKQLVGIEIVERCETNAPDYFYLYVLGLHLNDGYLIICNGSDENSIIIKREKIQFTGTRLSDKYQFFMIYDEWKTIWAV
ncbi:hypothetical protein Q5O89_09380 [Peribacillus frigoritolerans]|nr:hypothetical protein [Peribacillus frigoritolerans]